MEMLAMTIVLHYSAHPLPSASAASHVPAFFLGVHHAPELYISHLLLGTTTFSRKKFSCR
jgi:hypothetical protein